MHTNLSLSLSLSLRRRDSQSFSTRHFFHSATNQEPLTIQSTRSYLFYTCTAVISCTRVVTTMADEPSEPCVCVSDAHKCNLGQVEPPCEHLSESDVTMPDGTSENASL